MNESDTLSPAARLAVSSWSWHAPYYAGSWSLLDMPAAAASLGISAIECNDFMLPPPRLSRLRRPLLSLLPGAPPELWRYSRATLRQLLAAAHAHHCAILAWTVNSDFTVPAHHWPAQQFYLRRALSAARFLGASLVRLNLGGSPSYGHDASCPSDASCPPARDPLIARRLASFAAATLRANPTLSITLENHWGVSADIDRHLRIFDHAAALLPPSARPRFGCCFDPANMPDHPDRDRWWSALAARANHYHLKTAAFTPDGDSTDLPHARLIRLLRDAGYQGYHTIEYAGDDDPAQGVIRTVRLFINCQTPV